MLSGVARKCSQNKRFFFCVSNPCFELWLILHLEDVAQYAEEDREKLSENKKIKRNGDTWTKQRLRELMGSYRESQYDAKKLLPEIEKAIERARNLDIDPNNRWPQSVGTRVYRLVNSILEKR